ncbi:MAG: cyclic nucleotide-binding domain-containing protein, partial [Myxococcota bacterium]
MSPTVLVAHGSTRALKKAVQELQLAGCDVIATPDGGDAFARFFEDAPAAVICSANLPSLSGINFARMVRSQSPETQVVILAQESIYDVPSGAFVLGEPLHIEELRRILPALFPGQSDTSSEAELQTPVFVQAVLRRFERDSDLLKAFDDAGIRDLSDIAQHMNFEDGERIIAQGEPGDSFYLVVEGQVRVTLAERDDAQVARIGPGGFFGEMSMLSDQPRSASVWSVGHSTLLYFAKEDVSPLLGRYPRVREVLSGVALKRTEDNLWSVLFEESEVDETLAELESSLTQGAPPAPEAAQAPTTARVVERGEALPQNDHSAAKVPETPFDRDQSRRSFEEDFAQDEAGSEIDELARYGAGIESNDGSNSAPNENDVAQSQEEDTLEKRRRHEDVTASFPALGSVEDTDHETFHGDDEAPREAAERKRRHEHPTVEVAAYRREDVSLETPALDRARAPKRSSALPFIGGAGLGFAVGLAAALFVLPAMSDDPVESKANAREARNEP